MGAPKWGGEPHVGFAAGAFGPSVELPMGPRSVERVCRAGWHSEGRTEAGIGGREGEEREEKEGTARGP
eukprot:5673285-Pyramimonas_sp.AAC.1